MNKYIGGILSTMLLASCSEYQKALKSEDPAVKLTAATHKYEQEKYTKAIRLFEQIAPVYRGKADAENLYYMFAKSYFVTEQYYLAGYQFESFNALYPKSKNAEEAAFLGAKSYSELSPVYSLDQTDTEKAISKMQEFINKYPNSTSLSEANKIVLGLQQKLEKKAFEIAKQYNTISDYKAALKALDNFLIDYPGTVYKEKALFYKLDSAYKLAINSVTTKMEERLKEARLAYNGLMKFKADSSFKKEADQMLVRIEKDLQQFQK
ncbi:outer membrane protein assembly factor BamD [Flavobacterium columnare NBRC 100251 = ATCC 23463]|uniref:Lipoprotein n=1 Tax=Flavobacterium columnare (strain ATCC 49512 / CIP 103533 / TG 44/87) TaxID=1041826 RepID=G8X609_FLACA|nr:outer membrane protein assembly factor BamD [Flavobacterium columnare]AEW86239.1 lipoprotein [Flavobacterium columnare ATCC 49512]ANO48556.1 lipoprotein [Flavobacterium columnare]APT23394.1 outer membrane protein assembly factor BamD [Flavobacterium columnare]MBF6652828.1 outer membrane protein assembly factor BamD [Flavobacterium columnare]MBF6655777.1 outer membrane protein assembly factor BamD [Flavobacterium columnare]